MRDMNDMWVKDDCKTIVHCRGYAFTISELLDVALSNLSDFELMVHMESPKDSV